MGDTWIVRYVDDATRYLLEDDPIEVWVERPEDAQTFTNAGARRVVRSLGEGRNIKAVRKFEEVRARA